MKKKNIKGFKERWFIYKYLAQRLTIGRDWGGLKNIDFLFKWVGINPKWDDDKKLTKLYGVVKRDTLKQIGTYGEYVLSEFLQPPYSGFKYPEWSDGLRDIVDGVYALISVLSPIIDEAFELDDKRFIYTLKLIEHKGSGTKEKYNPDWLCGFIYKQKEYVYKNYFDDIPYGGINTKRYTEWLEEK